MDPVLEERRTAVAAMLRFEQPLAELEARLDRFPWDCEARLVALTIGHVQAVLTRFLARDLDAEQVEQWANLVEVRDDIDYEHAPVAHDAVFRLANPLLAGTAITASSAKELLVELGAQNNGRI